MQINFIFNYQNFIYLKAEIHKYFNWYFYLLHFDNKLPRKLLASGVFCPSRFSLAYYQYIINMLVELFGKKWSN